MVDSHDGAPDRDTPSPEHARAGNDRAGNDRFEGGRPVPWGTLATLFISFFGVGVTVSVALVDRGTPASIVVGAAVFVFSATSELAYIAVRDAGGTEVAAVLSGWLVASRFGLLATALGARFGGGTTERALAAICSFDPNVAVAVEQKSPGAVRSAFWWSTAAMMSGWGLGTGAGLAVGNVVADVDAWGIDAVFPAALLAIIGPTLRRRSGLAAAACGAAICLALTPLTPGGVPILASVFGAVVAVGLVRPGETPAPGALDDASSDQSPGQSSGQSAAGTSDQQLDGGSPP